MAGRAAALFVVPTSNWLANYQADGTVRKIYFQPEFGSKALTTNNASIKDPEAAMDFVERLRNGDRTGN